MIYRKRALIYNSTIFNIDDILMYAMSLFLNGRGKLQTSGCKLNQRRNIKDAKLIEVITKI